MVPSWPLVGRADELKLVERALCRADVSGVVVAGAAGVGKTRLAGEVLRRAEGAGRVTAWAQATGSATSIAFGALAHLLPVELRGFGRRNLLRVAGEALVGRAEGGRLVLGVDDAHLLDDFSAALVRYVAATGTCFVVATVRSGSPAPDAIGGLWKDGLAERVELQPLSRDESDTLVSAALGGHVDGATLYRLWEASRGNVLFLRELVLGGLDAGTLVEASGVWRWRGPGLLSPRLVEVIDARVGDVTPAELAVLEIVAAGEPIESSFLDALVPAAAREAVERRGLLQTARDGRRGEVRLAHPLYAEAVRAKTPLSRSVEIWQGLADLLKAAGARRRGDLLRLATWRLDAGDSSDAELLVEAAQRALALLDHPLAERLARAAASQTVSFEARFTLAAATTGLGNSEESVLLLADLESTAATDYERAVAALRRSDNLFWRLGRGDEAIAVLDRAAQAVSDPEWRAALSVADAGFRLFNGATFTALETMSELIERPGVDPSLLLECVPFYCWAKIVTGRCREALELSERVLPVALQLAGRGAVEFEPEFLRANWVAAALVSGQLREAEDWAREAYERSTSDPTDVLRGFMGFAFGWATRVRGRCRAAATVLEEAATVLRDVDLYRHRSSCLGELAHCRAVAGDLAAAEAALSEAEASTVPSFVMDVAYIALARAAIGAARAELSLARTITSDCARRCESFGYVVFECFAWHDLARYGDPAAARAPLASRAATVDGGLIPTFAAHAAALDSRDPVALDKVSSSFEAMGCLLYAAEAAAEAAALFAHKGMSGRAAAAATNAERLAAQIEGACTPALTELETPTLLTRREREIASLAARGLTNREIAERLVVSVRTVDNHLHNAYSKLGINNRDELAAIVLPRANRDVGPRTRRPVVK